MITKREMGWDFDNTYVGLPKELYSKTNPNPVSEPELVILNKHLAESLGLNVKGLLEDGIEVFAGNKIPEGAEPIAQAYAGHQFGHFTMLGDGRAVLLGEQITPNGGRFDIQLKGAGRTPFSRGGDGRAAIGPMLREYIISEAMHGLRIPTTRSLAVVTTGEPIYRETVLPGAILTRVASSHIRVGTFQYITGLGKTDELRRLADYTIKRHYPEIKDEEQRYLALLREVVKKQAALIAKWQIVGFIHGVMNTDNMAISGETIDYGPCAFMDTYDPKTVFSSIDTGGRYAYGNQPYIGGWNLARFAESLLPLLHDNEEQALQLAQDEISKYNGIYRVNWLNGMRAKLGLFDQEEEDTRLIEELLEWMEQNKKDYTNTFVALTFDKLDSLANCSTDSLNNWQQKWKERQNRQKKTDGEIKELMLASNPAVIPRNHQVEEALVAAAEEDYSVMGKLLEVLKDPFAHSQDQVEYAKPPEPTNKPYRTFCGT
ncbi:protein adenylyltransferase SelO [Bacillus sp. REN16]|uniref:protein adenylyltransferase SelO n=1 Tax=Bacillus sp. REN16 TaxID=2887296 RepID=UPI001E5CA7BF|nr:YdiU family protein [Bacillus sp. REN16]MCC3358383.1 YdiU family protein [Bacillus sp. REN16]